MPKKLTLLGSMMLNSGVPMSVLRFAERYTPIYAAAPYTKNNESRNLPAQRQADFVTNAKEILSNDPKRILCYSSDNIDYARQIALAVYSNFIYDDVRPLWHLPSEEFDLKQDECIIALKTRPNIPLIVLDNLSTFMGNAKAEKITKTLALCYAPIILVMAGKRPYQFCSERLGFTPDFILRAEKSTKGNANDRRERI